MRRKKKSAIPGLIVRPAEMKDLKACARILNTKEVAGGSGWTPPVRVLKNCMGKYFLVAEQDGKIIGAAVVEPLRRGVIGWWFAVEKRYRGKGVGSALMTVLEKTAKKDGKYFFLIYSKVGTPAVKFYEKRGYERGQDFTELIKGL